MERQDTDLWGRGQVRERQDSAVWGRDTSWTDPILLCGGDDTSACIDVHRMSVGSIRHCLLEYRGGQIPVALAADTNRHRTSVWSIGHGRSSLSHFQDWYRTFQGVRYAVTTGGQQAEQIAMDEAFLDRTSLLILADDWFGKWKSS